MNPLDICTKCFEASIPECAESIIIGGFTPSANVILYVENFHAKKNAKDLVAGVDGKITLDYNQFGKGFFASDNSPYIFTFKTGVTDCTGITFNQCVNNVVTPFSCLAIDFFKTDNQELFTNEINCQC